MVLAWAEFNMADVDVIGFDYDYTLANYTKRLPRLVYEMALEYLVQKLRYPPILVSKYSLEYDDTFACRGEPKAAHNPPAVQSQCRQSCLSNPRRRRCCRCGSRLIGHVSSRTPWLAPQASRSTVAQGCCSSWTHSPPSCPRPCTVAAPG